jgi:hypothetical protein
MVRELNEIRASLRRARNADGGWGYRRGNASRLEPTCWSLLALRGDVSGPAVLQEWPTVDGLLLEHRDGSPNYGFHGLALLTMRALRLEPATGIRPLLAALQRVKGNKLQPSTLFRQDNSLQGWSWIADTFSWVEPTAWCLLGLKQWMQTPGMPVEQARIDEAERLLLDRSCIAGGWNYGNANAFGEELKPFVPTTAIALLSLKDRASAAPVQRSLDFLERHATAERSGVSLSLALMALSAFKRPAAADARQALIEQLPTTASFGNQMAAAMALYALEVEGHAAVVV